MNKEDKIRILQTVTQIESINSNEAQVADYLAKIFADYHIYNKQVKYSEGRHNLIAEMGTKGDKVLAVSGHMDVVAPGDDNEWTYPPFSGEIVGDKLYGRGTTDMKAGLAALVVAMCELKEEATLNGVVRFLGTVGEEIGRVGSKQLVNEGYADDIDGLLIGEPTGNTIAYTHKGSMNFTVTAKGKSAHSSMPEEGINSITHMAKFIQSFNHVMEDITNKYENPDLGRTAASITVITGGEQVNSIPAKTTVQGNIRTIPEFPNDKIKQSLASIIETLNKDEQTSLSITWEVNDHSVAKARDSKLVQIFDHLTTDNITPGGISPVTDSEPFSQIPHNFDLVIYGPGVAHLPHQTDEYVNISDYLHFIDLYKEAIKQYLS